MDEKLAATVRLGRGDAYVMACIVGRRLLFFGPARDNLGHGRLQRASQPSRKKYDVTAIRFGSDIVVLGKILLDWGRERDHFAPLDDAAGAVATLELHLRGHNAVRLIVTDLDVDLLVHYIAHPISYGWP